MDSVWGFEPGKHLNIVHPFTLRCKTWHTASDRASHVNLLTPIGFGSTGIG